MRFSYDLAQAEPIIRDYPVYDSSATALLLGMAMSLEGAITTAANRMFLQKSNPAVMDNFVGVLNETGLDASSSAAATGVTIYGKIIINPLAVYRCEYSQHADDDGDNGTADSTGKTVTITTTTDREGDWVYITGTATTGGAGNLAQIGASTGTTAVVAVTSYDDNLKGNLTTDKVIFITSPFSALVAGGGLDLSAVTARYGTMIKGAATVGTGQIVVLQNYIETSSTGPAPLNVQVHSGNNYPYATTKLYADIHFSDHLLLGAGLANRVIT